MRCPQCVSFTGLRTLGLIKVSFADHLPLFSGKFTTWLSVADSRRNGFREGMAGVDKGPDGSKSGCFGICQGVLTMVDVVMTLPSGQVLALTRSMPDFAVRGRSERSPARLRRRNQGME